MGGLIVDLLVAFQFGVAAGGYVFLALLQCLRSLATWFVLVWKELFAVLRQLPFAVVWKSSSSSHQFSNLKGLGFGVGLDSRMARMGAWSL